MSKSTIRQLLVLMLLIFLPLAGVATQPEQSAAMPTRSRVKDSDKNNNSQKDDDKKAKEKEKEQEKAPETKKAEDNTISNDYDGIDVSKYQLNINWEQVKKNHNVQYVYIKATEGCDHADPKYEQNIRNARAHGVKVGSYHFFTNRSSATAQFENFMRTARKDEQDLIPFIDVETCKQWTPQQLRDSLKVFADLVEDYYGVKPIIYTYERFFSDYLGRAFAGYPLFIAKYSSTPPKANNGRWIMWQFTDNGRVAGINFKVDLSRFNRGVSLRDILYKPQKGHKPKRRASDAVDHKDKPSTVNVGNEKTKEKPALSKRQQEEAKKKAEREKRAKEREKKLAQDEAKKKAAAEKKAREKAKQKEEQLKKEKARQQKAKEEAEAKAKRKAAAQKAREQKAKEQAAKKANSKSASLLNNNSSKLSESQRNDSIRAAKQKGRKINKSSADND